MQNRGGQGVKIHAITDKTGPLVSSIVINDQEEVMLVTNEGVIIRLRGGDISTVGRISQGVKLIQVADGVKVVGVAKIQEEDVEDVQSSHPQEDLETLVAQNLADLPEDEA